MNLATVVKRSLRYYWRTDLGVLLAAGVATAVLVGALVVGDSVRYTLRAQGIERLGRTHLALATPGRVLRAALAGKIADELGAEAAPVFALRGTAERPDGKAGANSVQVLGVDRRFRRLGGAGASAAFEELRADEIILNETLAEKLGAAPGEQVILRIEKPGLLSPDAPLGGAARPSLARRLKVRAIASAAQFGDFTLRADQLPPANAFVPLRWLQEQVELPGRCNAILLGGPPQPEMSVEAANAAVRRRWTLQDAELELRKLPEAGAVELRSTRVFLDPAVGAAAARARPAAQRIFTYFLNELRLGDRATPYSIVSAMEPAAGGPVPPDMRDDEVVINQWLADDLSAGPGDRIRIKYFVVGPGNRLIERTGLSHGDEGFRVRAVVPTEGTGADRELMPNFPGLAQADHCRQWAPGIPIDYGRIRRKDEDYWTRHRGAPKAFFTLAAGQRMWGNRFGDLTAVRWPAAAETGLAEAIREQLNPATAGLFFQPVRRRVLAAGRQGLDFGHLFLAMSFFLVAAAVLLTALLFALGTEHRRRQVGTLLALGLRPRQVRRMLLLEGGVLAAAGAVLGGAAGLLYTRVLLAFLATVWRSAVASAPIRFHAEPLTVLAGSAGMAAAALATIRLVLWRLGRRSARELLAGIPSGPLPPPGRKSRPAVWLAGAAVAGAAVLIATALRGKTDPAGVFFASGALLLVAALAAGHAMLASLARTSKRRRLSPGALALRNVARRPGRSLAVVGLLACGSFLVVAVGANRKDPLAGAAQRSGGTGGFALYGTSSLPIRKDLNSAAGRKAYGLGEADLPGFAAVPLRVRDGDDASCLNLNRAQTPRLLGVRPEHLASRGAFAFAEAPDEAENPWELLNADAGPDVVPAIGDQATIIWALGRHVGDTLQFIDERGRGFRVRLVAAMKNSILQGSLLISEEHFVRRFPSEAGYRAFLIDAPAGEANKVAAVLSAAPGLRDAGLQVTRADKRLAMFSTVENTYLSIFQALGGLGMLLGSVGLAVVVLRNVMERRGELALLRAVGFSRRSLRRMVLREHAALLVMGLACGVVPAVVAVLPALRSAGGHVPYASLAGTLSAILISGAAWTYLAAAIALRGPLLDALRNE